MADAPRDADKATTDAQAREKFLGLLRESANVSAAARDSDRSRQSWYELRDRDPAFKRAWEEALQVATDDLEGEARRRAFLGYERPIYQRGELVGVERCYSDTLMTLLLKAHRPERFSERQQIELSGRSGKAIEVDHGDGLRGADQLAKVIEGLEELGAFTERE